MPAPVRATSKASRLLARIKQTPGEPVTTTDLAYALGLTDSYEHRHHVAVLVSSRLGRRAAPGTDWAHVHRPRRGVYCWLPPDPAPGPPGPENGVP